jgi:hypothetical protein
VPRGKDSALVRLPASQLNFFGGFKICLRSHKTVQSR